MIASTFSRPNAAARAEGRLAANVSRCACARRRIRSRVSGSRRMTKSQGWLSPTLGAWCAAASTRVSVSSSTGSGRKPFLTSRRAPASR